MKNEVSRKDGIGEYSSSSISISPLEAQIYPDCSVLFRSGVPVPISSRYSRKARRDPLASQVGLRLTPVFPSPKRMVPAF